jgi:glyoxylase-like metal-dependent hydrolase (beta-lactamase superfamily II)
MKAVLPFIWLAVLMLAVAEPSHAAAPLAKTQAPGFYRMMLGDFEITALNDGVVAYQTKQVLPTATPEQINKGLADNGLTDPVEMSYNAFLVNTGTKLVLIDTGTGGKLQDDPLFRGAGHLMDNLRASGYQPEQVDEVYITHRGQDHVGGLTIGHERAFPNAVVRASRTEFDKFLDPEKAAALLAKAHNSEAARALVEFEKDQFEPYIRAGKFQTIEADVALAPGLRALATPGHTPGHTSYIVESRGHTLIVMGDLVLMGALQFADPSLGSAFDVDPTAAAQQRVRVLAMAADKDIWLAGGHLSFPGIGHVRSAGDHYLWIPANYSVPH